MNSNPNGQHPLHGNNHRIRAGPPRQKIAETGLFVIDP